VITDRYVEGGRIVYGEPREGDELARAKELLQRGTVDLSALDEAVERLTAKLALTMPDCLSKTVESVRKHKLEHWDRNRETNRAWLALNMMTEARAGFTAFHLGKDRREVDFLELRRRLARGETWGEDLVNAVLPELR
jgi:6-oxo-cyclohex-1-ene-carbonyl-CoA hydrolase